MTTTVFVTGATGVLGRPVVRLLVEAGYRVRGLARSPQNGETLRALGAEAVEADLFQPASLYPAISGAGAVLHLATHIPPTGQMGRPTAWADNDRIRRAGTHNLVQAALDAQVDTLVYPGVVFGYPDRADEWIDETAPPDASGLVQSSLEAEAEVQRFTQAGHKGITLRMGTFYGPASPQTQEMLNYARMGFSPVFGRDSAYQPLIWIDDAARAVVAALRQAPPGVYNVVDDEPLRRSELSAALARAAGRSRLIRIPTLLARLMIGAQLLEMLGRSQRVSNRRFKESAGWAPEVPSAREGWGRIAPAE